MPLKRLGFFLLIAAVSAPLWTALAAAPTELLANGSFESGATGWQTFGGQLSSAAQPAYSGSFAAAYTSADFKAKWFYQDVPVTPGGAYTFSGWAVKNSPKIAEVKLRISWYGESVGYGTQASGPEISNVTSTVLSSDSSAYRQLTTGLVEAPSKAIVARLKIILMPASGDSATAFFDGLSFIGAGPSLPPTPPGGASGPGQEPADPPDPPPAPPPPVTPAATPAATPTPTPSPTYPPTPGATVVPTPSPAPTPTITPARTPTPTLRPTRTPTLQPTSTPRPTPTPTARPSPAPVPTPRVPSASSPTPPPQQSGVVVNTPSTGAVVSLPNGAVVSLPNGSPRQQSPIPARTGQVPPQASPGSLRVVTPSSAPIAKTATPPVDGRPESSETGPSEPGEGNQEASPAVLGQNSIVALPSASPQLASPGGSPPALSSLPGRQPTPARTVQVATLAAGGAIPVAVPPLSVGSPDGEEDGHEARDDGQQAAPQQQASTPAVQIIVALSSLGAASVALSLWLRKWV